MLTSQNLSGWLPSLTATQGNLGDMVCVDVVPTAFGGWSFENITLPVCWDVSYPASLYYTTARALGAVDDVGLILWWLNTSVIRLDRSIFSLVSTMLWQPPAGWGTNDCIQLAFDPGTGVTWPAHTFEQGDLLGIRLSRAGTDPTDTYLRTTKLFQAARIQYTGRCRGLGGCM